MQSRTPSAEASKSAFFTADVAIQQLKKQLNGSALSEWRRGMSAKAAIETGDAIVRDKWRNETHDQRRDA